MALLNWLKKNKIAVIAIVLTLCFAVANSVLLLKDFYYLSLLPLAGLVLLLFITKFETGLLCMALLTPFAIDMALFPKMELSMPVEPMMILFTLMFFFRVLASRSYDTRLLRHPVTLALLASLAWMLITSCTSSIPLVSFKYLLARIWFVVPFFFAAAQIFRDKSRIRQFFWCYAIGLIAVVAIATAKTMGNFSDLQTLHRVMKPFYNDHTAYGCCIALFLPAAFYFIFSRNSKGWARLLFLGIFALLVVGLFFSYCRAAWLSVLGAIGVYVLIRMGMKVKWMALLFALGVGLFFTYQSDVIYKLGKNHQDSSYDLQGQIKSISNISTDASNLERLNRWASAFRMWKEDPILGCGPGTYQFLYASYQRSYQLSTISTNAGNLGNAHSEYIGPLTEQGVPGVALVVCIFMTTFATGVRVYRTAKDRVTANMALAFTLSLLTYYIHGFFNNFLDTDKLSVPFWAFTAVIVALDVYSEKNSPETSEPLEEAPRKAASHEDAPQPPSHK
ncbi:MAG: O-antigen ligase family protein [Bacteroidales bacterium]|nr:O-antigen ligase family protein [Bacteroidales bacterium]